MFGCNIYGVILPHGAKPELLSLLFEFVSEGFPLRFRVWGWGPSVEAQIEGYCG